MTYKRRQAVVAIIAVSIAGPSRTAVLILYDFKFVLVSYARSCFNAIVQSSSGGAVISVSGFPLSIFYASRYYIIKWADKLARITAWHRVYKITISVTCKC